MFSESTARVSGHCVANVDGVQHRENGPTPLTGPSEDEGHPLLFSFRVRCVVLGFFEGNKVSLFRVTCRCLNKTLRDAPLIAQL